MTLKHSFASEDYHGVEVCVCVFSQGDGAVNETKVKSQNAFTLQALLL